MRTGLVTVGSALPAPLSWHEHVPPPLGAHRAAKVTPSELLGSNHVPTIRRSGSPLELRVGDGLVEQYGVVIPPSGQYATDVNLRARQRLWQFLDPPFDLLRWVLDLTQAEASSRVLDVGCGNGSYLTRLATRVAIATGCDLSLGMLKASARGQLVNADAEHLPFRRETFDVVLAAHMLYHVPDQRRAVAEMRRVLSPRGTCVVVTNGAAHIASLRQLVESVVQPKNPGWRMFDWATRAFSLDAGEDTLRCAFATVELVRPPVTSTVIITDADVVADYVASVADAYQDQVAGDWAGVVESTRQAAQAMIDRHGRITTKGDTGAFVCR